MRSKLIIILIFLIPSTFAFGQVTITGKILSQEDSTGIPGVSIIEVGTSNEVKSDINGEYLIVVSDTARFLEYSFVGFLKRTVQINGQKVINTILKPAALIDPFDQEIGLFLLSGIVNTPFGLRFYFSRPVVGRLAAGFQIDYLSDFELNEMLSAILSLSTYRIVISDLYIYNSVDLNYRKLSISNKTDLKSYSIENYARINNHKVILGLGMFVNSLDNFRSSTKYGLLCGYEYSFPKLNYTSLTYKMGFYKKTIEYHLQIDVPFKRIKTFVNYNKIDDYQEIMIGLGFQTYYYTRHQKNLNRY